MLGDIGAIMLIDQDRAALTHCDTDLVQPQIAAVGLAPDGPQHQVGLDRSFRPAINQQTAIGLLRDPFERKVEAEIDALVAADVEQLVDDLLIIAAQHLVAAR